MRKLTTGISSHGDSTVLQLGHWDLPVGATCRGTLDDSIPPKLPKTRPMKNTIMSVGPKDFIEPTKWEKSKPTYEAPPASQYTVPVIVIPPIASA